MAPPQCASTRESSPLPQTPFWTTGGDMDDTKQRPTSDDVKTGNHDRRGKFGPGNNAGTGGRSKYENTVRKLLREDCHMARELLRSTMEGVKLDGTVDADITHDHKLKAAEVTLKYGIGLPKQTHKVEHRGDPLATVSPEQLVEFIKGRNE